MQKYVIAYYAIAFYNPPNEYRLRVMCGFNPVARGFGSWITKIYDIRFVMLTMCMCDISSPGGEFMRFIGRAFELRELEEEYGKGNFALSVIYGRRRVGKTYLIKEFLKRKKGYFYI